MPKSVVSKKKLFREFSRLNQRYVKKNYLKDLRNVTKDFCRGKDIFERELMFMLWAYDLEFWTIRYAAEEYDYSEKKLAQRIVYELVKQGYVYKHFDKLTPSDKMEDHLFREETKYNFRVRYGITQKARLLVQAFYRELEKN
jgi:hypothetical protein|tara:strand:- start:330 stop:755 length:426 start_codon:yes stop_codon:yes gene_type:complete